MHADIVQTRHTAPNFHNIYNLLTHSYCLRSISLIGDACFSKKKDTPRFATEQRRQAPARLAVGYGHLESTRPQTQRAIRLSSSTHRGRARISSGPFPVTKTPREDIAQTNYHTQTEIKMANDGQFGLPSLLVAIVIAGLIYKYAWPAGGNGHDAAAGGSNGARDSASQARQREAAVERIQQMFPQVDRRTILWDLQRNGGSIATTTERILSGTVQPVSHHCCWLFLFLSLFASRSSLLLTLCILCLIATHQLPASTATGLQHSSRPGRCVCLYFRR